MDHGAAEAICAVIKARQKKKFTYKNNDESIMTAYKYRLEICSIRL